MFHGFMEWSCCRSATCCYSNIFSITLGPGSSAFNSKLKVGVYSNFIYSRIKSLENGHGTVTGEGI